LSGFNYGFGKSKNRWNAIQKLLENCEYLEEKLDKLSEQFRAACELLGVAFSADDYEAYRVEKKEDKK
jgi:hypothetical protein